MLDGQLINTIKTTIRCWSCRKHRQPWKLSLPPLLLPLLSLFDVNYSPPSLSLPSSIPLQLPTPPLLPFHPIPPSLPPSLPPSPPLSLPPSLPQAVPAYIEKVNWGSLAESLEVYSLLDQISDSCQEFPVEVSLSKLQWNVTSDKAHSE